MTANESCPPGARLVVPVQVIGAEPVQTPVQVVEPDMLSVQPVAPATFREMVAVPEGIDVVPTFFTVRVRDGDAPPTSMDCVTCRVED